MFAQITPACFLIYNGDTENTEAFSVWIMAFVIF